ncbi:hypothetical protein TNCV_1618511 [Trichonephila clavipes]|nr:hypothetical protein TNCV_1618511 [Trichonephila clavipes]
MWFQQDECPAHFLCVLNRSIWTWNIPEGLGIGECGQHPCPPENCRACRKRPVQHEFYVDVSGDSRVQWSDETRLLLYVLATWEDLKIIPPDLIGISLSVLS